MLMKKPKFLKLWVSNSARKSNPTDRNHLKGKSLAEIDFAKFPPEAQREILKELYKLQIVDGSLQDESEAA